MSDIFDIIHELLPFITFPITKAIFKVNFFGIQTIKISIMQTQDVSPYLLTINKIVR